ncbi:hypothetical protein [Salinactinospora qingdaonensis]
MVGAGGLRAWAYAYCLDKGGSFTGGITVLEEGTINMKAQLECNL